MVASHPTPEPAYGRGDPVGWHAGPGHRAGSGIVLNVRTEAAGTAYEVQQLIDGRAVGHPVVVMENNVYPTRGVRDTRPQPAIHREPRS